MAECPKCNSKNVRREIENVYEIGDTTYFDYRIICDDCIHTEIVTVARKDPIPKARDDATGLAASLKLRDYMPERKESLLPRGGIRQSFMREIIEPLKDVKNIKEMAVYGGAVLAGLGVQIAGAFFERYLRVSAIDPLTQFVISLMIWVFGPILVAGWIVYRRTGDRMKAILIGSLAVPLNIIILPYLRVEQWLL